MNLILRSPSDRPPMRSPLFFARLIDDIGPDRIKNLKHLEDLNQSSLPFHFVLLDATGKILAGDNTLRPPQWDKESLPKKPYEFIQLGPDFEPEPPFPRDPNFGAPGFGNSLHLPRPPHHDMMIRLPGEQAQYLVVHFKVDENFKRKPPTQVFALSFVLLICSVLLGVGVALAFIFRTLAKNVVLADSVIAELQKGNLKARFPIKKRDEFGAAMMRFNKMADEIELLVERLVNTEKSRMTLLQELAHDLRTPVASLKNLLETLQTREGSLEAHVKTELISLSVKEIDYFERLIEDLLILAQVSEPRYHAKSQSTDLVAILVDEAESAAVHVIGSDRKIKLSKNLQISSLYTQGDPLLLRRMFRNVLLNAFSFAKQEVKITLSVDANLTHATILIEDDGPGFTLEGIKSYGVRRMTRVLGSEQNSRLSVGLGSVIAKTVAELHRSTLIVENRTDAIETVSGARIIFNLNLFA